jgi:hypothetical protein
MFALTSSAALAHAVADAWRSLGKSEMMRLQFLHGSRGPARIIHFAVTAVIVAGAGLLSACATERSVQDARRDYERSVADYENCLAANQMSTCEGERRIMKANKRVLSANVQG